MKPSNIAILSSLFLVLLLTSCANNNDIISEFNEDNKGEDSYLSISLNAHNSALKRGEVEEIDPWEYRVNEVWILLYNENDILDYKFVLHIRNYRDNDVNLHSFFNTDKNVILEDKSGNSNCQTLAQKIKKKSYKIAMLANPPAKLFDGLSLEVNSSLSKLTAAIDGLDTSMFGGYEDEPGAPLFFMSNANGLVSLPASFLKSSIEEAHKNPVQVNMDRILAKVLVKEKKDGIIIFPNGVILDKKRPVKWYLDRTNKSTFLIRKFAKLADGSEENEINSPKGAGRENIYAEDPNFSLKDNSNDQFKIWETGESIPYCTWISDHSSDPDKRTFQYVLENTMNVETQSSDYWRNYATRVVLETYLIYPELLWNTNDPHNESDPNRNYYSCQLINEKEETNWRIFTHEQAFHWLNYGFPYTTGDEEENKWIMLLEEKIRKVQNDYNLHIQGAFNFLSSQLPGTDEKLYRNYDQVTYHPLGLNKYNIPIRHFGAKITAEKPREEYGYYGIVRNNMYTVTINSITGPGTGIYEWDNRYISVDISITPWFIRKQGADLGYD